METRFVSEANNNFNGFESVRMWFWNILGSREIMALQPDPRVQNWLFMSSPWPTLSICAAYIIFVKLVGPWLMQNRPPFNLRVPLILYSGSQVLLSMWLLSYTFKVGWFTTYNFACEPVDYTYSDHALMVAGICWYYYILKFIEFFDTFFFVLRKKNSHISFLHAFHHGIMPVGCWVLVKYVAGGHTTFEGTLNTFVHVIMYFYYMISAMGPKYEKFLWWKKYLTTIQLVQFTITTVHNALPLFFVKCDYPKPFAWLLFINSLVFFALFLNFYLKAYNNNKKHDVKTSNKMINKID